MSFREPLLLKVSYDNKRVIWSQLTSGIRRGGLVAIVAPKEDSK
jgi:hypothetical protein